MFVFLCFQLLRDDIENSQFDLDEVHQTGEKLLNMCGEPDRPEVQKNIDDLDNSMLTITAEFDKRSRTLEDALERSMNFQDELMVSGLPWLLSIGFFHVYMFINSFLISVVPMFALILWDKIITLYVYKKHCCVVNQ